MEIERKYVEVDLPSIRDRLKNAGAISSGPYFEKNTIFSTTELLSNGQIIRLRCIEKGGSSKYLLTYKKRIDILNDRNIKVREEIETYIEDYNNMYKIIENLGFKVIGVEEKIREHWEVDYKLIYNIKEDIRASVELDYLPFGNYVEIEGNESSINWLERHLGLDKFKISTNSYFEIYRDWLLSNGLPVSKSFRFSDEELRHLKKRFGI